jgi:hypothetical protein
MTANPDETPEGTPERPALRVSMAERESAMRALDEHLAAGRLDPREYADRSAAASEAKVAEDLNKLFTDLPNPHPDLSAIAPVPATQQSGIERPARAAAPAGPTREDRALGGRVGVTIMAVTPIAAVALFFITGSWLWFLLIPAVGALIYGGGQMSR